MIALVPHPEDDVENANVGNLGRDTGLDPEILQLPSQKKVLGPELFVKPQPEPTATA